MVNNSRLVELIIKYSRDILSVEEKIELGTWVNEHPFHRVILEKIADKAWIGYTIDQRIQMDKEAITRKIAAIMETGRSFPIMTEVTGRSAGLLRSVLITAASLFAVAISVWIFKVNHDRSLSENMAGYISTLSTSKHLTLRLSNGDTILLDRITTGDDIGKDGWRLHKTGDDAFAYLPLSGSQSVQSPTDADYNTLSVPYGRSCHITLPDGSTVYLNAGSVLSYQASSSTDSPSDRVVYLKGEAYFEIAANSHCPFNVMTRTGRTTALGTSFNLRDYARADGFQATLVSGSIRVNYLDWSLVMKPGEEVRIDQPRQNITISRHVNTDNTLSWKSGWFDFNGKKTQQIMQEIVDWYGLDSWRFEKELDSSTPGLLGGGQTSRTISLPALLKRLSTPILHLTLERKMIIITRNH